MKILRKILGIVVVALGLMLLPAASAQAAPFTMSVDNAILDLGSLSGVRAIDPELEPPDPPATLTGELTGNTVNVPKAGFVFPPKTAEVSAGINAVINMEANEDITGTFDAGTGKTEFNVSLKATVGAFGSNCVISPIVLTLSSDNAKPYLGEAFTSGIEGNGVIGASWANLPPVTGGGLCATIAGLVAGPGGIAMSHGVHDFKTCATLPADPRCGGEPVVEPPSSAPILNSAPSSTTEETTASFTFAKAASETQPVDGFECSLDGGAFEACDSGNKEYSGLSVGSHSFSVKAKNSAGSGPAASYSWTVTAAQKCPNGTTGTPPNCLKPAAPARFGALKATPKNANVKRGKKRTVTVKVKNVGKSMARGVKVCVNAPKALVSVKKCVNRGALAAGATATAKFNVTVKRKAKKGRKATLKFTATANGIKASRGNSAIRVR